MTTAAAGIALMLRSTAWIELDGSIGIGFQSARAVTRPPGPTSYTGRARSLLVAFGHADQRGLGGGQPGDRHAERRA